MTSPEIQIVQASLGTSGLIMAWRSEIGRTYRVQLKEDLNATSWTDLAEITASSSITSRTSPIAPHLFLRIQLVGEPIPP
jgi:hypothetical protein